MKPKTRKWFRQLSAAMISGGSGTVITAITLNFLDPDHFNISTAAGLLKLLVAMTSVFGFHGFISVLEFLRRRPLPEE